MKIALSTSLLLTVLMGCQSAPQSAAHMATLQVLVIAEPKAGAITGNTHVLAYDAPVASAKGQFEKVDYSTLDDIVVYLQPVLLPEIQASGRAPIDVDIDEEKPVEGVTAIAYTGARIHFHNRGLKTVDLYSVSDGNEFDLGRVPPGGSEEYHVIAPGVIEVLADSAKDSLAVIYVAPTWWVKLAHAGDSIDFTDLLPGTYKVVSWHPRLPGQTISVNLLPDQITRASIKVGVNDLPKIDGQ